MERVDVSGVHNNVHRRSESMAFFVPNLDLGFSLKSQKER